MSTTAPTLPYRLEPSDLSTLDTAPIRITREIVVPAPREAVWATISDAEAMPTWFAGVTRAIYTSEPPIDVGATRFIEIGRLQANEEILAFDPPERFAFRVVEVNQRGLAAMVEDIVLDPDGADHTQLRYRQAVALRPPVKILSPLIRRQLNHGLRRGLDGLGAHHTTTASPPTPTAGPTQTN